MCGGGWRTRRNIYVDVVICRGRLQVQRRARGGEYGEVERRAAEPVWRRERGDGRWIGVLAWGWVREGGWVGGGADEADTRRQAGG